MAPPPPDRTKDGSKGRSKRKTVKSKPKTKPRDRTQPRHQATPSPPAGFQRLDNGGVKKVPSNAPTMAIAPSDYEHIFHEGPGGGGAGGPAATQDVAPSPPLHHQQPFAQPSPALPPIPVGVMGAVGPRAMGYAAGGAASPRPHFTTGASPHIYGRPIIEPPAPSPSPPVQQAAPVPPGPPNFEGPLHITADGYTLLGQTPDERHSPLPPHIVRATNQFSRAALARIANYLATRAER